jgi:hypothetical protein
MTRFRCVTGFIISKLDAPLQPCVIGVFLIFFTLVLERKRARELRRFKDVDTLEYVAAPNSVTNAPHIQSNGKYFSRCPTSLDGRADHPDPRERYPAQVFEPSGTD